MPVRQLPVELAVTRLNRRGCGGNLHGIKNEEETMTLARKCLACLVALSFLAVSRAHAEPYLAVRMGLKCTVCHVNPTGGGLRTEFGDVFSQTQLPAHPIRGDWGLWTGHLTKWLRMGGNFRYDANFTHTPGEPDTHNLQIQQGRLYGEAEPIPNRLIFYVDEQVTPGPGAPINHEAYAIYWSAAHDWYIKAGRMYLPFAFRFEDQTAFVYDVSSITMYSPDRGVEFGWLRGHWDVQLNASDGNFNGPFIAGGKEYGLQMSYVESGWRMGLAANDDDSPAGRRRIYGIFGGTRTGPVDWLGELDASTAPNGSGGIQTQAGVLLEGDWLIAPGNNLKLTMERYDPDRDTPDNGEARWSLVYELTPIQFVQLRAGVRDYYGPKAIPSQRSRLTFVQLHVFF